RPSRHVDGGPVRQTVVEMEAAYLFVTAAGQGACLAVVSDADADIGLVAYEMAMLVIRVGESLAAPARSAAGAGDAD
ncbi:roadblock/LC7 domain-containing protein, partial [Micromonospora noduli]|uniref:roadblock/LC7 domain-containing protein n=1 Tax=Micromonospora noduli TaxID=709876 RepID=UPI0015ECA68E